MLFQIINETCNGRYGIFKVSYANILSAIIGPIHVIGLIWISYKNDSASSSIFLFGIQILETSKLFVILETSYAETAPSPPEPQNPTDTNHNTHQCKQTRAKNQISKPISHSLPPSPNYL